MTETVGLTARGNVAANVTEMRDSSGGHVGARIVLVEVIGGSRATARWLVTPL